MLQIDFALNKMSPIPLPNPEHPKGEDMAHLWCQLSSQDVYWTIRIRTTNMLFMSISPPNAQEKLFKLAISSILRKCIEACEIHVSYSCWHYSPFDQECCQNAIFTRQTTVEDVCKEQFGYLSPHVLDATTSIHIIWQKSTITYPKWKWWLPTQQLRTLFW